MKNNRPLLLISLLAFAAAGCLGPKSIDDLANEYKNLKSYEVTIKTSNGPQVNQIVKLKEGQMLKFKMATNMGWTIVDVAGKATYTCMGKNCMKMPYNEESVDGPKSFTPTDFKKDGKTKTVGTEKIDNVECLVLETEEDGKKHKVWIGYDGLTRKLEGDGNTVTMTYSKINAVPDKDFEIPEGIKIRDMSKMMRGLKGLQNMMGQ